MDVRARLVLEHHVRPADCVRLGVEFLAECDQLTFWIVVSHVLLAHGEHPARPARGIEHRPNDPWRAEDVVVLDEQQVHHQADDFARREVLAGCLVAQLGELAKQLLVDVAHLDVADLVGMEVDFGHFGEDEIEQLRPVEAADLGVEVELLDDVARLGVELGDPGAQVAGDLGRVGQDAVQGQRAGVVCLDARQTLEDDVARVLALDRLGSREHLWLGGLEDAIEAAQQDQRQDYLLVFGALVVAAEQVSDGPDEPCVVVRSAAGSGVLALVQVGPPKVRDGLVQL